MAFSLLTKNLATFVNQTKNFVTAFLLKEDGMRLLLETGGRIILEESEEYGFGSKNTATFSLQTKNLS